MISQSGGKWILMILDTNVQYAKYEERIHSVRYKAIPEEINAYKTVCEQRLRDLTYDVTALSCNNVFCTGHINEICNLYNKVIQVLINSAEIIPTTTSHGGKAVPGWNQYVECLKRESLHWHKVWVAQGRPHLGDVAELMRISRARYHIAVKDVKKLEINIRMDRMVNAIRNNNHRDLFAEVRKIKGKDNFNVPCIDGCHDDTGIVNNFLNKYKNLYNSVPYDILEMNKIKKKH